MADIWLGRFERWLEKFYNAKGGGVVMDHSPSITAMIPILIGNEDRYLQGWNRYWQDANVAANAANSSATRLRNPAGSNVIVVVEKLHLQTLVTTFSNFLIQQGSATTDLTTASTGFRMDTRGNPNSSAILSIQNTTPANLATTVFDKAVNSGLGQDCIVTENQEFTILPGDAIQVVDQTVNEQIVITWMWRERPLESSELT